VNEAGDRSKNALYLASAAGHEALVEMLLRNGADPNFVYEDGSEQTSLRYTPKAGTALDMAVKGQHVETVRVLLDNGAQFNAVSLHEALRRDSTKIVQLLLHAGADVHAPCGGQRDALTLMLGDRFAEAGHIMPLLRKGANTREKGEGSALYLAAAANHAEAVSLLLDWGVDVDETGGEYGTALQACSAKRHVNIAHELLSHRADSNAKGGKYGNALYAAVRYRPHPARGRDGSIVRDDKCPDQEKLVSLLIEYDADLYTPSKMYRSALHAALCEGTVGVVSILLEHIQITDPKWRQAVEEQLLEFAAETALSRTSIVAFLPESCDSILASSVRKMGDTSTETRLPDQEAMLDLNQKANAHRVAITSAVIEAACRNLNYGAEILELLSQKVGQDFAVTEAILVAALLSVAERCRWRKCVYVHHAQDMITFLLDKRVDHIQITPAILTAAAKLGV
jgi:ankyrin repeat protein